METFHDYIKASLADATAAFSNGDAGIIGGTNESMTLANMLLNKHLRFLKPKVAAKRRKSNDKMEMLKLLLTAFTLSADTNELTVVMAAMLALAEADYN